MPAPAVEAQGLSKLYHLGSTRHRNLRDLFDEWLFHQRGGRGWKVGGEVPRDSLWALREVAFQAMPGEAVAVIGRNGSGKSTLLRILARITAPTSGRAVLRGRVAPLLQVGAGFHPELSGRENVFLNGALMGMDRAQVQRRLDEVVAFAGVERFLDVPVKRYSNGMYLRLAFSVAAHLEAEVLLLDEVLTVGDAEFQARCVERLREARRQGRTLLVVSHSAGLLRTLCDRALWLEAGSLVAEGPVGEVLDRYAGAVAS